MRNVHLGFLNGLALTAMVVGAACSNSSGGSPSAGAGSSSGGAATAGTANTAAGTTGSSGGTCASVSACAGSVVGSWTVTSSCLTLSGPMDVSLLSLACPTVPVTGSVTTTGSFVANADGTFTDNTRTTGSATFPLAASCLKVSSVPVDCAKTSDLFKVLGWTSSTCTDTNGQCNCTLGVDRPSGIGFVSDLSAARGNYTSSDSTFKTDDLSYAYCASGETLKLTPQQSAMAGTVVLTKGPVGSAGSGAGGGSSAGGSGAGGGSVAAGAGGMPAAGGQGGGSAGSTTGGAGAAGSAGGAPVGNLPCDIYAAANNTCVAAHSTIRSLLASYSGNLYQVKRASDGTTKDIPVLAPGGFANSMVQDTFCTGTTCTIIRVYDQSGHGNFLEAETPDTTLGEGANAHPGHSGMTAASATAESLMVGGHKVYSLYTKPSQAYWRDGSKTGMPIGSAPQGIYIVTSGKHFNGGCCYDYGNGEVSRNYVAGPSMDALYFGSSTQWATGNGTGPWVMADMEDGMIAQGGGGKNNSLMSQTSTYVTAMEKNNGTSDFALKAADATVLPLNTYYSGALPASKKPMKKQGSIVLGSGGDCCYSNNNASQGTFYEGAIVAGYPSDATDTAIHANIVNAGYGK